MTPDDLKDLLEGYKMNMASAFGGVVGCLLDVVRNGRKFSKLRCFLYVCVAVMVGEFVTGFLLPEKMPGKGGFLMILGTLGYQSLEAIREPMLAGLRQIRMPFVSKIVPKEEEL